MKNYKWRPWSWEGEVGEGENRMGNHLGRKKGVSQSGRKMEKMGERVNKNKMSDNFVEKGYNETPHLTRIECFSL